MTAAANKEIEPIEKSWSKLVALIDRLTPGQLELKGNERWSVKDHLAHIAAWELSLLALLDGKDRLKAMGVPGAADDTDSVNEAVWLAHRDHSAKAALDFSRTTHERLMERIGSMSDEDLRLSYNHYQPNDPRDPNDDRPVIEWVAGNTYEHYDEHAGWIQEILS